MAVILIIDDDTGLNRTLAGMVRRMGHESVSAHTLQQGLELATSGDFDCILLDVNLPDGNGLKALPKLQEIVSDPEIIIITGEGDPDGAELAIENGAWDYIRKPSSVKSMMLPLMRALQYREGKEKFRQSVVFERDAIVGKSSVLNKCIETMSMAANSEASVLLFGQTGTGKEIFAKIIHENSRRSGNNFVVVDCAALPENLVESMLFGHVKGAYTGADKTCEGLLQQADGGTLFLDEIGELSLSVQKSFLRILQERCYRPVGSSQEINSDFRIIAATNRDLDEAVANGEFRSDLLFRLRSFFLSLPPLQQRRGDIRELAMFQLARICDRESMDTKGVSPDFLEILEGYHWPGNVRELFQTMEVALATAQNEPILFPSHLPIEIRKKVARTLLSQKINEEDGVVELTDAATSLPSLKEFRQVSYAQLEQKYLRQLLSISNGKIKEACKIADVSRGRLYELMKQYDIQKDT